MTPARIFWAVTAGFLVGVFARSFVPLPLAVPLLLVLLALASLALTYFERERSVALALIAVALFSCAGGVFRLEAAQVSGDTLLSAHLGQKVTLEGKVIAAPDARDTSTLLTVAVDRLIATSSASVRAGILALLPPHAEVGYGDRVQVTGTLRLPEAFDTGLGRQFPYPQYLAAEGITYQLAFAQVYVETRGGSSPTAWALIVRNEFVGGIRAVLPEPQASLAGGITVGDKRSVGPELTADFQKDSLVHMLVLSGYNITVVIAAVAASLKRAPRSVQFCSSIGVVVFFILMSGGAASATRAGLMALIAVGARALHRLYLGERALAAVAFLLVLWNPFTLAFDPSFQLSALATLGLILFGGYFSVLFSRVPERFGLREILASTCATQFLVLPLLLYTNGTLSLVSLPANLLALAPVPLAMLASCIAALAGMTLGSWGVVFAAPAYILLRYIIAIAHLFASLPFAAISVPAFSAWWMVAAYVFIFGAWLYMKKLFPPPLEQAA